jgi:hypothetical protein
VVEASLLDSMRALTVDPAIRLSAWSRHRQLWDTPDELALSFSDWFEVLRGRRGGSSSERPDERRWQLASAVDEALDALNSAGDEIWSDESFRDHALWAEVRRSAALAIEQWESV